MATSPILGYPLPNSGGTDQVPADLLTLTTALEKNQVMPFASASARDAKISSPSGGMVAWLTSPGKFVYYDAIAATWMDLFNPGTWDTWTPTLQSTGGTAFSLGSGATQVGRYQRIGKTVNFQCQWSFGSSVIGPGGQLVWPLPPSLPGANITGLAQIGPCRLQVPSAGSGQRNFMGFWAINPGSTIAQPYFPEGANDTSMEFFQDTSDGATAGTGRPNIAGSYPIQPGGALSASGTYQIA